MVGEEGKGKGPYPSLPPFVQRAMEIPALKGGLGSDE